MKKRAQLTYKAMISLIASAMVIAAFYAAGNSYGNSEAYYKLAVAKDLALMLDLVYSYNGNVDIIYPNELTGYDVEVYDQSIRIYGTNYGKEDLIFESYSLVSNEKDIPNFYIKNPKFLNIQKRDGKVIISEAKK